jgi:hypothetical protein
VAAFLVCSVYSRSLAGQGANAPVSIGAPAGKQGRSLIIPKVSRAPAIDDFANGKPREAEIAVSEFVQREPNDGKRVSQPTTAYLSYDDQNLYIVFVCGQASSRVRGHLSKRDDIDNDDQVSVYLDTFRDQQHAYVFSANPFGVQEDGMLTEGQKSPDYSFDTLWYSEGRITSNGYIVWMSIPFKSVRFSNAKAQSWSIALERTIMQNSEKSFWPHITTSVNGFAQQMAKADGLESISPGRNIQITPYGVFTYDHVLLGSQPPLDTQNVGRAGADIKAVLKQAFTLDGTLNPDFSQVESDDPQVTVNQRYRVYFPEKRPFFLDNASYFQTPIDLFFTRNIEDPQLGARFTGTINHWAIGMMASDDRGPGEGLTPENPLAHRRAIDGVFTLHRQFSNQSTLGLLATNYNFGSTSNQVFSLDTRDRLSSTWFFTGQFARSFNRQPGGQRTQGQAELADLYRAGRHFIYDASYAGFSPNFSAPLGFIQRVDIQKTSQYASYLWKPEEGFVVDVGPVAGASADWDHSKTLQDWSGYAGVVLDLKGSSGLGYTRYQIFERYLNHGFHYDKNEIYVYGGWLKWLSFSTTLDQGAGVNYQPAGELAPFTGNTVDAAFDMVLRPTPRLRLDEIYYYDRLKPAALPVVYSDHFWRTKLNFQFTRPLSIRAIVDYYAVLPNAALFQEPPLKQLTGDILLTYLLNPGTALYIGYNNQHQNLAADPTLPTLAPLGPPTYLTNSQIFVKLSYQLRF